MGRPCISKRMDQETKQPSEERPGRSGQDPRRKHRRRPPPGREIRIFTKYAPRRAAEGQALSCTTDTTLKPEQLLELYRYLKLTRLFEERLVDLYRQTKVV